MKIGVTKMRMNGKMNNPTTLQQFFQAQCYNQNLLVLKGVYNRLKDENTKTVPVDDIGLASYHIQQLMSEIGEVLEADKRWKSHRNDKYDKQKKLEEIADCFVVLMNVAIFSGFDEEALVNAIEEKIGIVADRITNI